MPAATPECARPTFLPTDLTDIMPGPLPVTHLLYLHGFRSSPQSIKALKVADWAAKQRGLTFWCPQLPPSPAQAAAEVMATVAQWPRSQMAVMGSSLGGFYATWVAEQTGCPAVLINPAVDPARDLAGYIGEQTHWHDPTQTFFFQPEFVDELRTLTVSTLTQPARYQVWAATGDEVLDWREMHTHYATCDMRVVQGSDHALSCFDDHMRTMLTHLNLAT